MPPLLSSSLIKSTALSCGFSACGIARVEEAKSEAAYFDRWIAEGCHAAMQYMENNREIRLNPAGLVEGAKSVISVALNYYPDRKRPAEMPHIAYYAYGKDYHIVVKERLRQLWDKLTDLSSDQPQVRFFTDSAPILERYWAWKAGLGWIGKNTNLIIPGKGSFFFIGEIITTWEADCYDTPMESRCGDCTRCLDACPTGALEKPCHLNARKCLSYLTIENRDEIPPEQARQLGNRLYGCDTCQEVCPWNRFAVPTSEEDFRPTESLLRLTREEIDRMTEEDYRRIFAKSAVKRAKYAGLIRTRNAWRK